MDKILAYIRKSRKNRMLFRVLSGAACVVFFVTTYMLIYPAITMSRQAICGQEVHAHTDECYSSVLICGLEESEGHQHDDSCYESEQVLACEGVCANLKMVHYERIIQPKNGPLCSSLWIS